MKRCPNTKCNSDRIYTSSNASVYTGVNMVDEFYWTYCGDCSLKAPDAYTEAEAKELWDALPRQEDIHLYELEDLILKERDLHSVEVRMLKADIVTARAEGEIAALKESVKEIKRLHSKIDKALNLIENDPPKGSDDFICPQSLLDILKD